MRRHHSLSERGKTNESEIISGRKSQNSGQIVVHYRRWYSFRCVVFPAFERLMVRVATRVRLVLTQRVLNRVS